MQRPRTPLGRRTVGASAIACCLVLSGCGVWRTAARYEGWTLYEMRGEEVSVDAYSAAFSPAFEAVEANLGAFHRDVDVHAWHGSVRVTDGGRSRIRGTADTGVHDVPGIGPARIQAYHARGGGGPFSRSGVFIGVPDPGTAVHELAHARFAELDVELPLWFEEGVATLMGDGLVFEGRWVIDGLVCWPLRELREELLTNADLARLVALTAADQSSVRDNVLVHFVGWAVVFDLYRETGVLDWSRWLALVPADDPVPEVRRRLERTLSATTELVWLDRLADPDPAVRLATAKGVWKLRSRRVLDDLLAALEVERHPEVRVGMAINALAAAGELSLSWRHWRRVENAARAGLRGANLADPTEQRATENLLRAYRHGDDRGGVQDALRDLSRFWEE